VDVRVQKDMAGVSFDEWSDAPILYLMDYKNVGHKHYNNQLLWPVYSSLALQQGRQVLAKILGEPGKREDRPGSLKPDQVLAVLDGRNSSNAQAVVKDLRKYSKQNPLLRRTSSCVTVRLMYHNREFAEGGHLTRKRRRQLFFARLPEPLENLHIVLHKDGDMPGKSDRQFIDVPGSMCSRGIANLSMPSPVEAALHTVTLAMADEICKQQVCASSKAEEEEEDADVDDGDNQDLVEPDSAAAHSTEALPQTSNGVPAAVAVTFMPWQGPEVQYREWYHLFGQSATGGAKRRIVEVFAGNGAGALAAARDGYKYTGYVWHPAQKDIVRQKVLLAIVLELILNKRNGFEITRFLSRARSLGGSSGLDDEEQAVTSQVDSTADGAAASSQKKQDADGQTKKVDSSSSSDSDSS
jgi:hypothetical protein